MTLFLQCVFISVMLTIGSQGEEYITALYDAGEETVLAATGQARGWYQVQSDSRVNLTAYQVSRTKVPSNATGKTGIANNTVLVKGSNVDIYFYKSFSQYFPLPISALGNKYIVSSCLPPGNSNYSSVLVIASHSYKTDLDITFRLEGNITYDNRTYTDGDTLTVSLQENQTLTINSDRDLSGTVVMATQTVAVFSVLNLDDRFKQPRPITQLLPVHLYGQEYVVAVDDNPILYQIQIVSEAKNTRITFNDGSTVTMDKSRIFKQNITINTSLHFSSSKPVMTMLCRLDIDWAASYRHDFVVLPPVSLYTKQTVLLGYASETLKILTDKQASDIAVKMNSTESI